jgi:F-type H+-transporting ATPase subunit epsilon
MALPKHLRLEFVTPERPVVQDDVDEVEMPGELGDIGVLPGHAALLAALRSGMMWYRKGTERKYAFVDAGYAEVGAEHVSILARAGERSEEIDVARAEAAKKRAEEQLAKPLAIEDAASARQALQRAVTRLHVARQTRTRG